MGTSLSLQAGDLDTIGVTLVRQFDATLRGGGVRVAQVEPPEFQNNPPPFEVNPATVGQSQSLFAWVSSNGIAMMIFPNSVGVQSTHACTVGNNFYGLTNGAAPQVMRVDNFEAEWFVNHYIAGNVNVSARVISQSFGFNPASQSEVDTLYDDYIATNKAVVVSVVGNGGPILPPGTCFNGIGVGIVGSPSAIGPTADGRCKPDLTAPDEVNAPAGANSYSTPYVSGSAAILIQAANRGDGGASSSAASDLRAVKALLINGAVKPAGWTNGPTTPLDARYGAGLVNIFNSWTQLKGGKQSFIESTLASSGGAHPPGVNVGNVPTLFGWDTNSLVTSTAMVDRINHYYFNLPGNEPFTLTATLAWNKQQNKTAINDLDLFLYDTSTSNLVASSVSTANNVEHVFLPRLPSGRYDLQVLKKRTGQVSSNEVYALAFEIFSLRLKIARTNNNVLISWPAAPTGFRLQSTADLNAPSSWAFVNAAVSVDTNNSQNVVSLPLSTASQFFRLQRP